MNEFDFIVDFNITPLAISDAQYQEGGGDLPPYQEDFFQRIVNVSWAVGLAVEFQSGSG